MCICLSVTLIEKKEKGFGYSVCGLEIVRQLEFNACITLLFLLETKKKLFTAVACIIKRTVIAML